MSVRDFLAYYGMVVRLGLRRWWRWIVKYWLPSALGTGLTILWQWWIGVPADPTWKDWIPFITYFAIFFVLAILSISLVPVEIEANGRSKLLDHQATSRDIKKQLVAELKVAHSEIAEFRHARDEPKVSPLEKARLEECQDCLCQCSEQEQVVLRRMLTLTELDQRHFPTPTRAWQDALVKAQRLNIVTAEKRHGTMVYKINPEMRTALENLLLGS